MTLACPNCQSQFNLDDSRIPAAGMQLRCPKCGNTFNVTRQGAQPAKVELPGPGGSRPTAAPARPPSSTAVPLPGSGARAPSGTAVPAARKPTSPELDPNELFGSFDDLPVEAGSPTGGSMPDVDIEDSGNDGRKIEPPSLDLGADLGMQVPQMAPARPAPPAAPARPPPPAMSRAPAESLEVLDPSPAPRPPPSIGRSGPKRRFQIQRASGKVFGPFEEDRIAKMLAEGELAGNEQVKGEDGDWEPLSNYPIFVSATPRAAATAEKASGSKSATASEANDVAPVRDNEGLRKLQQVYGDRMAAMAVVEVVPVGERIRKYLPAIIGGSIGLVVLALGLLLGLTTYGAFGRFLIFGPPHASSSSTAGQAIAKARAGLRIGTYGALKAAVADAARAHAAASIAVDAEGLMAQTAAALAHEAPGDGTVEIAKARDAVAGALAYGPNDPDVLKGQAALAWVDGQGASAKSMLDQVLKKEPAQVEALYLLGETLSTQDRTRAAQAFKQALAADSKLGKAHLALAELAQAAGDLPGALVEAQKAVEVDPQQVRAKVLIEQLAFASGKVPDAAAEERLRGLADEKSGLSPAQRAAVLALVARIELRAGRAAQSKKELEAALKIDSHSRDALLAQAGMLLQQHHGAEALTALQSLAPLAAKDLEVADVLAQVQIDQGHYADANQTITPQLALHPDNARLQTLKGIAAASLGKAEEAEKILIAALKVDPTLAEAHLALGKLYLSRNQLDKSRTELDAALARAPQSSRAHTGFAELLMAQSNREAARGELTTAIGLDPENAEAHFLQGKLLRQIGQLDLSLSELRTTEKLDTKFPGVHVEVGLLLESRDSFSEAAAAFHAATEVDAKDAVAWRLLGRVQREAGDFDGSLESLRKAANLNSQDSEVHVELALTLLKKTENAKALIEAKSAIEANPKNPNGWRVQGRVNLAIGSAREALTSLDKAAELDGTSADTQQLRGETLSGLKQFGPAVEAYRKAIVLDPQRAALLLEVGQVQVREKSYAEAIKTYKAALAHNPPFVEAYYLMARALDEEGKSKDAVKFYELAAKLDTQNAMPYRYLGYYFKSLGQGPKAVGAFQTYLKKKPDADDKDVITEEIGFLKGG